jgi:hypothetical protein
MPMSTSQLPIYILNHWPTMICRHAISLIRIRQRHIPWLCLNYMSVSDHCGAVHVVTHWHIMKGVLRARRHVFCGGAGDEWSPVVRHGHCGNRRKRISGKVGGLFSICTVCRRIIATAIGISCSIRIKIEFRGRSRGWRRRSRYLGIVSSGRSIRCIMSLPRT